MRDGFFLAFAYLRHHRGRTLALVSALTLTVVLPTGVSVLVDRFEESLIRRARSTPLILGSRGSRFDQILSALYFRPLTLDPLNMGDLEDLMDTGFASGIPLFVKYTARDHPIIGTFVDYFSFRGRTLAAGEWPATLAEAVIGSRTAVRLGLGVGDTVVSDQQSLYDIAGAYRVGLKIVGVLAPSGTPDDDAIFVDLKTAWLLEGIGHGHDDAVSLDETQVATTEDSHRVLQPSVITHIEVTQENLDSFHFHGDAGSFPLTSILVVPPDAKSSTLLKGRYLSHETLHLLHPESVVVEVLAVVFRVKRFLDLNLAVVCLAMAVLIGLILYLTLKLRAREIQTIVRIGGARHTVLVLVLAEILILLLVSAFFAAAITGALLTWGANWVETLVLTSASA